MVPAQFHDVTDDKIGLKHSFMCSAAKNSYLSCRTLYSDTSAEAVEARGI